MNKREALKSKSLHREPLSQRLSSIPWRKQEVVKHLNGCDDSKWGSPAVKHRNPATTRGIAMATSTIVMEIKSRWWVPVYLRTLVMLCILIRQEPDCDKVAGFIVRHGISKKVKTCPTSTKSR